LTPLITYVGFVFLFKIALYNLWTENFQKREIYRRICEWYYYPEENNSLYVNMKPNNKVLIAMFPHGMFPCNVGIIGGYRSGTSFKTVVASALLNIPIFGDAAAKVGFTSSSKENITDLMSKSENLSILPGGFNELYMTRKYEYNLFVPTGFIAMSIKYGYTIYPTLSFGENEFPSIIGPPKWSWKLLSKLMRYLQIPLAIPYNFERVPIIPYVGKPIQCYVGDDVADVREKVIEGLKQVFSNNIDQYCKYRNDLGIKPHVVPSMYSIAFYGGTG